ncbi:MAG: hypothetical protein HYU84_17455 [Chloroflexi bacterium]|nr:hypothetical protein [Chloroflexota bacterium]MBI3169291.1 hypothetical protein [Chloroflexota bacterium]
MNLIDRYVAEVGRSLLLIKGRKDIENELRSTLEDMLEERAQKAGKPADEAMQMEMLKEYGAPHKVAETYNPNPYLIGPRVFPFFMFILKIVIAAVTLGLTIATGIQIMNLSPMTAMELLSTIGKGLLNIISASIAAFGNLALIFALIERYAPASEFKMDEEKEWDPASLKKEPEPDDVKIWEPILAIVFTFIALSIFNFNPQLIGIYYLDGNEWHVLPVLSEAFFRWLPLMNIGWVAEIVLNGMLLRAGKWTTSTRLFSIGTKLFQIFILAMLISGPSILAFTAESLTKGGITDPEAVNILMLLAKQGMKFILGLAIFGTVIEVIKSAYKMVTQK